MVRTNINIHLKTQEDIGLDVESWHNAQNSALSDTILIKLGDGDLTIFATRDQAEQIAKAILSKLQQVQEEQINA